MSVFCGLRFFSFLAISRRFSTNILGIIRIKYLAWFPVLSRKKIPEKRVCFGPTLGIFAVLQFLICPNHPTVIFHRMLLVLYKRFVSELLKRVIVYVPEAI